MRHAWRLALAAVMTAGFVSGRAWGEAAATKPAAAAAWATGTKVEVKWGGTWMEASITNKRGEWYLVTYSKRMNAKEWVEPWRIRKVGSTEDNIGIAHANETFRKEVGDPPREKPGPAPEPMGAGRAGRAGGAGPGKEIFNFGEGSKGTGVGRPVTGGSGKAGEMDKGAMVDFRWDGKWAMVPDAGPAVQEIGEGRVSLKIGDAGTSNQSGGSALARGASPVIWTGKLERQEKGFERTATVERVDLAAKTTVAFQVDNDRAIEDSSFDGNSVLLRVDRAASRLEVWKLDGEFKKTTELNVFHEVGNMVNAWFTEDGKVIIVGMGGEIALWDPAGGKMVYRGRVSGFDFGVKPAVSRGARYLAVGGKDNVTIIEVKTGKVVGEAPRVSVHVNLAFSPSGKQLVACGGLGMEAWDLVTGKPWRQFMVSTLSGHVTMPVDGFALVGGTLLVDLEKRVAVWRYAGSSGGEMVRAGLYAHVSGGGVALMKVANEAETAAGKGLDAEGILAVKPGMKVSVEVSAGGPNGEKVREALMKALAKAGFEVADGQRLKFIAKTSEGNRKEERYKVIEFGVPNNPLDPNAGVQTVTSVEQISRFAVELDGKVLYERKSSFQPHVMRLEKDQSVADAMAKISQPNTSILMVHWVPGYWVKPGVGVARE